LENDNDQVLTKFLSLNQMKTILLIEGCLTLKASQSERRKKFEKKKNVINLHQSVLTVREKQ